MLGINKLIEQGKIQIGKMGKGSLSKEEVSRFVDKYRECFDKIEVESLNQKSIDDQVVEGLKRDHASALLLKSRELEGVTGKLKIKMVEVTTLQGEVRKFRDMLTEMTDKVKILVAQQGQTLGEGDGENGDG